LRVQAAGLRILYVPHARVSHQVHASTRHRGWAIPYYFLSRNRLLTMRTYGRPATYALFVPYFAALWTWKVLGFLTRRDWLAAQAMVRGLRDGLVGRFGPPPPDLLG
jgi:GT2 family glycosyltransferase